LDDLGLVGAVQAQAHKINQLNGLQVHVQAETLTALSAAVEVAAYRIIQEAIANVVRHSSASTCLVTMVVEEGSLRIEVCDDGGGIHVPVQPGVGMTSMRERAEELGGVLLITSSGKGTLIQARLPLVGRSLP
jgi:signal transduction histidine kinase